MSADFPRWRTVYDALHGSEESGAIEAMRGELRRQCRIAAGRRPEPSAAVVDSQSVEAAEEVARASRGCNAGPGLPCPGFLPDGTIGDFRKITAAAGLGTDWVPREMRHTFVSLLSSDGGSAGAGRGVFGKISGKNAAILQR
jgi:hypothetical protein